MRTPKTEGGVKGRWRDDGPGTPPTPTPTGGRVGGGAGWVRGAEGWRDPKRRATIGGEGVAGLQGGLKWRRKVGSGKGEWGSQAWEEVRPERGVHQEGDG